MEEMLKVVIGRRAGQGTFSRRTIHVVNLKIKLIVEHVLMNSRAERAWINGPDRLGRKFHQRLTPESDRRLPRL